MLEHSALSVSRTALSKQAISVGMHDRRSRRTYKSGPNASAGSAHGRNNGTGSVNEEEKHKEFKSYICRHKDGKPIY